MKEKLWQIAWLLAVVGALMLAAAGCASRRQRASTDAVLLGAEQLYQQGIEQLTKRNLRRARMLLERVQLARYEDRAELEPLVRLALADVTFYAGDDISLIDARSKYLDFVTLYGDHPLAPYAQFQAGVCSLKRVNHPSRDQSETLQAVQDLREVERRYPGSSYTNAARDMLARAESNLAEHEFLVGLFYFRRKAYLAASDRFRTIVNKYPSYREKEKVYLYLGRSLILGNNEAEGKIYLDKLVADYPDGQFAEQAKQVLADGL